MKNLKRLLTIFLSTALIVGTVSVPVFADGADIKEVVVEEFESEGLDAESIEEKTTVLVDASIANEVIYQDTVDETELTGEDSAIELSQDDFKEADVELKKISFASGKYFLHGTNYKLAEDLDLGAYYISVDPWTKVDDVFTYFENATFDLNGHTLKGGGADAICLSTSVTESFTLKDSVGSGKIINTDTEGICRAIDINPTGTSSSNMQGSVLIENINASGNVYIGQTFYKTGANVVVTNCKIDGTVEVSNANAPVYFKNKTEVLKGMSVTNTPLYLESVTIEGEVPGYVSPKNAFEFSGTTSSEVGKLVIGTETGSDTDVQIKGNVHIGAYELIMNKCMIGTEDASCAYGNLNIYNGQLLKLNAGMGYIDTIYFSVKEDNKEGDWSIEQLTEFAKKHFLDGTYVSTENSIPTIQLSSNTQISKDYPYYLKRIFFFNKDAYKGAKDDQTDPSNPDTPADPSNPDTPINPENPTNPDNPAPVIDNKPVEVEIDANLKRTITPIVKADSGTSLNVDLKDKIVVDATKKKVVFAKANNMPVVDGYTFKGWKDSSSGKKISTLPFKKFTSDLNVVAEYAENKYTIQYKITKVPGTKAKIDKADKSKVAAKKNIKYTESITLANDVKAIDSKSGKTYKLVGWTSVKNDTTPEDKFAPGKTASMFAGKTKQDKKLVLYSVWEEIK